MDVSCVETQPNFQKISLQREKENEERENFWDVLPTSLPKTIIFEPCFKKQEINTTSDLRKTGEPNQSFPNMIVSLTRGEILPIVRKEPDLELLIYIRKIIKQKVRNLSIIAAQNRSKSLSN